MTGFDSVKKCTAHSKRTGNPCTQPAAGGSNVCRLHGFNKGPGHKKPGTSREKMLGNKYALKHGLKSKEIKELKERVKGEKPSEHGFIALAILDAEEEKKFREILTRFYDDFKLNKSSDFYAAELVAVNLVLFGRAAKTGDVKALEAHDRIVRLHLKDLKATKIAREGETPAIQTTPAEWAAWLLAEADKEEKKERKRREDREYYKRKKAGRSAPGSGETATESKNSVAFDAAEDEENRDVS